MTGSDREHAADALVVLRRRVDAHFQAAVARSPGALACRPGCDACCSPGLSVFSIEADRIAAALHALSQDDPERRARVRARAAAPDDRCVLLVDGRCAIYDERPILCRSHGLPVRPAAADRAAGEPAIDHCPLNYREHPIPAASVLELAAVDAPLAIMAAMWDGTGGRVPLAVLAAR